MYTMGVLHLCFTLCSTEQDFREYLPPPDTLQALHGSLGCGECSTIFFCLDIGRILNLW